MKLIPVEDMQVTIKAALNGLYITTKQYTIEKTYVAHTEEELHNIIRSLLFHKLVKTSYVVAQRIPLEIDNGA